MEAYNTLEFRVRVRLQRNRFACSALKLFCCQGDGRKYIATLRTDNWISLPVRARRCRVCACRLTPALQGAAHDLWQAFLFAPADEWVDVQVPIARFIKTWRGKARQHPPLHRARL